jgi:Zn-finger nucleic acid-binding protein
MQCPICDSPLQPIDYEGVTIDVCESCGGEFLDADELGHIVLVREMTFPDDARATLADRAPAFGTPIDERRRQVGCPKCGSAMTTINYCGDTGVFVDRCECCGGFWLDADELEQIQILQEDWQDKAPDQIKALAGDLEKARQRVAARSSRAFSGSRFAFVNALINRILDAA